MASQVSVSPAPLLGGNGQMIYLMGFTKWSSLWSSPFQVAALGILNYGANRKMNGRTNILKGTLTEILLGLYSGMIFKLR